MATWLIFQTQTAAEAAIDIINTNMSMPISGYNAATGEVDPTKSKIVKWAMPQQRLNGDWVFAKPDDIHLTGVSGFMMETWSRDWWPPEELA